jgi:CRP-like cAMP-binding protein
VGASGRQPATREREGVAEALASVWPSIGTDAIRGLSQLATIAEPGHDALLMLEGEPTPYLAIVLEGRVAIRTRVAGRETLTILTVEPGDIVGWSAVVSPFRSTSTARAVGPVRLLEFEAGDLRALLLQEPAVAAEVYPLVLQAVARRLAGTRLQLLDLFDQRWAEPW